MSTVPRQTFSPDVFVTVGTDHHPFDRLVHWVDSWAAAHPTHTCLVQCGTSIRPETCASDEYFAYDDLIESMNTSTVVVTHGGPATIMAARAHGRLPVVVPRRPDLGEHVDDHQIRFGHWMANRHQVVLAETEDELHRQIDLAFANPAEARIDPDDPDIEASVKRFSELMDGLLERRYRP